MKIKILLRFYFAVDKVEEHIDRLVIKKYFQLALAGNNYILTRRNFHYE